MTATRIRETTDGALYRLSEPVEYGYREGDQRDEADYALVQLGITEYGSAVRPADEDGNAIDEAGWLWSFIGKHDPDIVIEQLGYEVITQEATT